MSIKLNNRLPAISTRLVVLCVCFFLAAITWAVFGRTIAYGFIPYDDNVYVYENPNVTHGLSLNSIRWAFTHGELGLWTPLTTISHMLDCQLYDLRPGGHHLTNVLLHIATVIALFLVLRAMTGALWRSAFVAAVFAIHPLRAESVAWVSERKDVLCGLFFMLTLGAYLRYVRKRSAARYAPVFLLFAFGLMAKQIVVTLPCLLLLLDYWPLKRFTPTPARMPVFLHLAVEKLPFFVLSILSCIQSFVEREPEHGTFVPGLNGFSWLRIENALVSYVVYIGKFFYPVNLSAFYPYPAAVPAWQAVAAFALLAAVSIGVIAWRKQHPEFLTGWFWYLGMLVPVIGFVSLGKEARADRYTYLPEIGVAIMVAWGAASFTAKWRYRRREILIIAAAFALATLARLAAIQTSYWVNGVTLWRHALDCAPQNGMIHDFLGNALLIENKDLEGAIAEYKKSIELMPSFSDSENDLGKALYEDGDADGAITHYNKALRLDEGNVEARSNLAVALTRKGWFDQAIAELRILIQFKPNRPETYNNLGNVLLEKPAPDVDGAIAQFKKALAINPDYAATLAGLGNALVEKGEPAQAIAEYQKCLQIEPENAFVLLNLARVLATSPDASVRNGPKAVDLASRANELSGGESPQVLDILAAAYAEANRFPDAIQTARRALEFATAAGNTKLANTLQARLALYRANTPLRIAPPQTPGH